MDEGKPGAALPGRMVRAANRKIRVVEVAAQRPRLMHRRPSITWGDEGQAPRGTNLAALMQINAAPRQHVIIDGRPSSRTFRDARASKLELPARRETRELDR
jgi:hypothetical protein